MPLRFLIACLIVSLAGISDASADTAEPIDFNKHIRPLLTEHCTACHGGVKQAAGISFVYPDQVLPPGGWVIEPGDPEASILIERVTAEDPSMRMPPPEEHPAPLSDVEIDRLRRWIAEGAHWGKPWSLAPLSAVPPIDPSAAAAEGWPRQPLDRFVLQRLVKEGLTPSAEAPPAQWLRQVSFDLTGLPPTIGQLQDFVKRCESVSSDPAAVDRVYEQQVDRLLASRHFGERWAAVWMDLARYADSKGFEKDPHRDMWPYRDWLIDAFNQDMPYDEFTIKQLAGDLLEDPAPDDLIATAFHRNTQTNTEGGTDDEQFRVAAVIDRINTTWTVWQATTFGCTQCHSHPYDAYRHEDYYACMALFNNTLDADLDSDYPIFEIPSDKDQIADAVEAQRRHQRRRHQRNDLGSELAKSDDWHAMTPAEVSTTGGQLKINGRHVMADGGTFPVGVETTVTLPAQPMTALKLDILPMSSDPTTYPEQGAVLTHVKIELVKADGSRQAIELADAFADSITGVDNPRDALNSNNRGIGGYPKLFGPRFAVLVPKLPLVEQTESPATADTIAVGMDDRLEIVMRQAASVTGNVATPIRHFVWSRSDSAAWSDLLTSERLIKATQALEESQREVNQVSGAALPIVATRPVEAARPTRKFIRGNWMELGEQIEPGIPDLFANTSDKELKVDNRLEFARWLVSDQNPLAARTWANRIWAQLFGIGLAESLEDFGSSGLSPSHPQLLDHLAIQLRDVHQWHLKPLLRQIVLSSTYRQTHDADAGLIAADPKNRLFTRGPRTRLSAEMIRDQALRISGLWNDQIGGRSVMPPQPDGVWQTVYSGMQWKTAKGDDRYRRGLYTYWRRTSPYPSFLMFDAPTRDLCSPRRIPTNTPLQALVTLNDPVYSECAQALARRAVQVQSDQRQDRSNSVKTADVVAWMFRSATSDPPTPLERDELVALYKDLCGGSAEPADSADAAINWDALTIVANTILNLDKALTK